MFCSNCGSKVIVHAEDNKEQVIEPSQKNSDINVIETKQKKEKKKMSFKFTLDFVLTIIVQLVIVISVILYYKIANPSEINFVISSIIGIISTSCLFAGGYLAFKNLKNKNLFSIISLIYFCYSVITSIISDSRLFINTIKYSYEGVWFKRLRLICLLVLLILTIVFAIIENRKNKKILKFTIIIASVYLIVVTANGVIEHFETKKLYADLESLSKEYNNLKSSIDSYKSKGEFGTWTIYLSYDDPDDRYSKYDNTYRRRSRNCYKDHAIENAKDYLLIEHPRARNIYVDSAIYEGYSSSID